MQICKRMVYLFAIKENFKKWEKSRNTVEFAWNEICIKQKLA